MKLKKAIELGKACGLESIEESINNVLFHCTQLFPYPKINEELEELKREAISIGIKFCNKCGFAMTEKDNRHYCYMCEK